MDTPIIHVSWGELVDRLTILKLKVGRGNSPLNSIFQTQIDQYVLALAVLAPHQRNGALERLLARINGILWRLESRIRNMEENQKFDTAFICASRMICRLNDRRARIKAEIDERSGSIFVDAKSYR